eukprot:191305-Pelagomonas_calceolata.AAC.1
MVSGRGASTIGKNPVRNNSGDILRDFYTLIEESIILAGTYNTPQVNLRKRGYLGTRDRASPSPIDKKKEVNGDQEGY